MVEIFGKDLFDAYTYGTTVKEIYSNGVLVWTNSDYIFYEYLQCRWPVYKQISSSESILQYEAPRIVFEIPYIEGGFIIEASVMFQSTPKVGDMYTVFYNTYRNNNNTYAINGAFFSNQGPGSYSIRTAWTRSNIGEHIFLGNYTLKEIIPANNLDTKIYVDDTEVVKSDDKTKSSHTFSVSEPITMVLFDPWADTGSNHHLKRFKIMDSSNNLLYDFVPAVRKVDGAPGLLEVIHNTFHTKAAPKYSDEGVLDFYYGNY